MAPRVLEFPTIDPQRGPVSPNTQRARRHLEQLRQTRLKDCPFKTPVSVPIEVVDDAHIRLGPLAYAPSHVTWAQIADVTAPPGSHDDEPLVPLAR